MHISLKIKNLVIFFFILIISGCDIYNSSVPDYLDQNTNSASVGQYNFISGFVSQKSNSLVFVEQATEIVFKLKNPKKYELIPSLEYYNNEWKSFTGEVRHSYYTADYTTADLAGAITVKYESPDIVRVTVSGAAISEFYNLRLTLKEKGIGRAFESYELPKMKCMLYPSVPAAIAAAKGAGDKGIFLLWSQAIKNDLSDANYLEISCNGFTRETYSRNHDGTSWSQWKTADNKTIDFTDNEYSVYFGSTTPLNINNSYTITLLFRNGDGLEKTVTKDLSPGNGVATVEINGSGVKTHYSSLGDAFNSITDGQTAVVTLLQDILQQTPYEITGTEKIITLKGEGLRIIQLDGNGSLFTINSGTELILEGTASNTITLKGHSSNTTALVTVKSGGKLTMKDGSVITGNTNTFGGSKGGGVHTSGTFNMNGGTIGGNTCHGTYLMQGGGVFLDSGIFNMSGSALIADNKAGSGNGVYINNAAFNMTGGSIVRNSPAPSSGTTSGGGVFLSYGNFNMSGGTIGGSPLDKNEADNGSGVTVSYGTFIMTGGTISYNITKTGNGGGVSVSYAAGTFNMSGGKISHNSAIDSINGNGGGVFASAGSFTISLAAEITENKATWGGGVYLTGSGTVGISGGKIKGNRALLGGGAFVTGGNFTMSNGSIVTNDASHGSEGGGGLCLYGGNFTMTGGAISSNTLGGNGKGSGIYTKTNIDMNNNARVASDNDIYLDAGSMVNIDALFGGTDTIAAITVPAAAYSTSTQVLTGIISSYNTRFNVTSNGSDYWYVKSNGYLDKAVARVDISGESPSYYLTLASAISYIIASSAAAGTVTVLGDINNQSPCPVSAGSKTITLKAGGNDRTITLSEAGSMFILNSGTLILDGSSGNKLNLLGYSDNNKALISINNGTTVEMLDGVTITGNINKSGSGGGVLIDGPDATFTMRGGAITGNTSYFSSGGASGGGVFISSGTFNMTGLNTAISSNNADLGKGVFVGSLASFNINGGATVNIDNDVYLSGSKINITSYTGSAASIAKITPHNYTYYDNDNISHMPILTGDLALCTKFQVTPDSDYWAINESGYLTKVVARIGTVYYPTLANAITAVLPNIQTTITLLKNISDKTFDISDNKKIVLMPSGHITMKFTMDQSESMFTISGVSQLVLQGDGPGNTLTIDGGKDSNANNSKALITVNSGKLIMEEGVTICKNNIAIMPNVFGGGVSVLGGEFKMFGGVIRDNILTTSSSGGGVYVAGGIFSMAESAEIYGNNITGNGGGVFVANGTFSMTGNTKIYDNNANSNGGGVYVGDGGIFSITGNAEISRNTANGAGGGVYVYNATNTKFTMDGGTISGNGAYMGGGVANFSQNFVMINGNIINQTGSYQGGGVYNEGKFIIQDGNINNNVQTSDRGAGVYNKGLFIMESGNILNNGTCNGGGVYVHTGSSFTMLSGDITGNSTNDVYVYEPANYSAEPGVNIGSYDSGTMP